MIGKYDADHGFTNGNDPGNGRNIVPAAYRQFYRFPQKIDGLLDLADRWYGFAGHPDNDVIAIRYAGQYSSRIVGKKPLRREGIIVFRAVHPGSPETGPYFHTLYGA